MSNHKRQLLSVAAITLLIAGCANTLPSPQSTPIDGPESEQTYTQNYDQTFKKDDPMNCDSGIYTTVDQTAVMKPVANRDISYVVSSIAVEEGITYAYMYSSMADDENFVPGMEVKIAVGESAHHEGIGTFTLTEATPMTDRKIAGYGGRATFCFEPEPGIEAAG